MNPDCVTGKHTACSGDGWDATDAPIPCPCECHFTASVAALDRADP